MRALGSASVIGSNMPCISVATGAGIAQGDARPEFVSVKDGRRRADEEERENRHEQQRAWQAEFGGCQEDEVVHAHRHAIARLDEPHAWLVDNDR